MSTLATAPTALPDAAASLAHLERCTVIEWQRAVLRFEACDLVAYATARRALQDVQPLIDPATWEALRAAVLAITDWLSIAPEDRAGEGMSRFLAVRAAMCRPLLGGRSTRR